MIAVTGKKLKTTIRTPVAGRWPCSAAATVPTARNMAKLTGSA